METVSTYSVVRLKPVRGVQIEKHRLPDKEFPDCPWDVTTVSAMADLENYRYFWFESIQMTRTWEEDRITFKGEVVARSGKYFINAYIEEYEDVLVNNQHLANQMTNLGWTHIVRSIALNKDDNACWTEKFDPLCDKIVDLKGQVND